MKLAPQQLQDESFIHIYGNNGFTKTADTDVTVRIYSSGKKAKRAIRAMLHNGWAYQGPAILQKTEPPLKSKLRRQKTPVTGGLPRMVVFYRR